MVLYDQITTLEHDLTAPNFSAEIPVEFYLDTKTNNYGKQSARSASSARRSRAFQLLFNLWEFSSLDRVRSCRRWSHTSEGQVHVRRTVEGDKVTSGYEGLAKCGSAWSCPMCARTIEARRREEIRHIVQGARADGLQIAMLTMTLRHKDGQSLAKLLDVSGKGYRSVMDSRAVRNRLKELGLDGYVRVLEINVGRNGWHPHYHVVLLFDTELQGVVFDDALKELADAMFRTWSNKAKKEGLAKPMRDFFHIERIDAGDVSTYLTKKSFVPNEKNIEAVGFEMAGRTVKDARGESRTPWDVFADFTDTGDLDDLDLWHEYEGATKGKRSITFSRGLKARYVGADVSDQDIVDEEKGTVEDRIFTIIDWSTVARKKGLYTKILDAVEHEGIDAALALCVWNGVPVRAPD